MPYINIQVTNEGLTKEKKASIIKQVTDLMVNILGKDPATTFVVIEEIDTDNWGVAGMPVSELRKQQLSGREKVRQ